MTIETDRLLLRPWEDSDAEDLYEYARDPAVGPIAGWPAHTSVADSLKAIRTVLSKPETYALTDKVTRRAVGSIGLMQGKASSLRLPDTEGEIGYWIGVPYWGRGLMPEAVRALLRRAFEDLGFHKVWCGYYEGNDRSKRVQEKCGFQYQFTKNDARCSMLDEIRTEHITCLTREDWLRHHAQD